MTSRWLASVVSALVGSGCATAPVHYYSLMPGLDAPSPSSVPVCCIVDLKKVTLPAEVDRAELVTRRSDDELDVYSNDVWLAPLSDEIRDALSLAIRRGLSDAARANDDAPLRRFTVTVDVERFESLPGRRALIQARWRVSSPGRSTTPSTSTLETTASIDVRGGLPDVVRGHQRAIAQIAGEIVASIQALRDSPDGR